MSTHTPGPWHQGATFANNVGGYDVYTIPISAGGQAIGCVYAGTPGRPRSVDNELANATLIAAAPELAEALLSLCEFRESMGPDMDHDDADAFFAEARAALAKAGL